MEIFISSGIANVQEYYNLNITELANGLISDPHTGKKFQTKEMSIPEMLLVGDTLLEDEIYDKYVEWIEAILILSQQREGYTKKDIQYFKSELEFAKVFIIVILKSPQTLCGLWFLIFTHRSSMIKPSIRQF